MIVGRITGQSPAVVEWAPEDGAGEQWSATAADQPPVSALMIEMGGVLYDDTCWRRWLFQLLVHVGLQTSYETFYRLWDADYYDQVCRGQRKFWPSLESYLRACGLARGICDEVLVAARARRRGLEDEVRPLPAVRSTLTKINAMGVSLVAVSNSSCPASGLLERLGAMRIEHLFQLVVSSRDIEYTMPDGAFFEATLTRGHLTPEHTAFVSRNDVHLHGARTARLMPVAVHKNAASEADIALSDFSQLCHAVPFHSTRRQAG
jgi:FMN phosphatase YigB (HAD superfamily)